MGEFDLLISGVTQAEVLEWLERSCLGLRLSEDAESMLFFDCDQGSVMVVPIDGMETSVYFSSPGRLPNSVTWARLAAVELCCAVRCHIGLVGLEDADLWFIRAGEDEYYVDEEGNETMLTLEDFPGACSLLSCPYASLYPVELSSEILSGMFAEALSG